MERCYYIFYCLYGNVCLITNIKYAISRRYKWTFKCSYIFSLLFTVSVFVLFNLSMVVRFLALIQLHNVKLFTPGFENRKTIQQFHKDVFSKVNNVIKLMLNTDRQFETNICYLHYKCCTYSHVFGSLHF